LITHAGIINVSELMLFALGSCGFTVVVKTDQEDIVRSVANHRLLYGKVVLE